MSGNHIPSAFVKNVLQNGVGRHVCQLQRLTLKFCKSQGNSRGLRDFIENHLLEFTHKNPGIVVYLQPRRHGAAILSAEYLNGRKETLHVNSYSKDEICQWVEHLRNRSGNQIVRLRKSWHTENPSVQGVWNPFTFRDPSWNTRTFPDHELSTAIESAPTATHQLLELAKAAGIKNIVAQSEEDSSNRDQKVKSAE